MDDSLSFESFLEGAKKAAHKAMDDHGRGEYDEFALHGGVAVERLAKAVLVSKNPVYLLEMRNGNPDMLLYLGGHLEMNADKVRTVGAKDAIKRVRTLGLLPADAQLDLLIELRNGTAHTSGGDDAKALLPALAQNVAALLKDINLPEQGFWGRWTSAMNMAVDKQRSEIDRDVQIRIRQARHLFEDRFKGLPDEVKERALQTRENTVRTISIRSSDQILAMVSIVRCPACGSDAQVKLNPLREASATPSLRPESLHCRLCALVLNTSEEIAAAGVEDDVFVLPSSVALSWSTEEPAVEVALGEIHLG